MELHYRAGGPEGEVATVRLARGGDGRFQATVIDARGTERPHEVEVIRAEAGRVELRIAGRPLRAWVAEEGPRRFVQLPGEPPRALVRAETRKTRARGRSGEGARALTANMHGQVVAVLVKEGDRVERGAPLVVLEAMKMELRVTAPQAGRVKLVACKAGEVVERGRVLVELEAAPEESPERASADVGPI